MAAAVLLITAGCGSSGTSSDAGSQSGESPTTLTLATGFSIDDIDPLDNGFWGNEFGWSELLMRPVLGGDPEPWLLEKLESVDDLTWRLTLKDGIRFQNGDPLDAQALAAVMAYQLTENSGLAPIADATVEATGDLEVTLTTSAPAPNMPFTLADESKFVIYDQDAYEGAKGDPEALIAAQIYTGPYVVESLDSQELVMPADSDYWGGTPALQEVTVKFIAEEDSRILAVQNGEADLALYPPTKAAKNLAGREDSYWVTGTPKGPTFQLNLNQNQPELADVDVRKAVLNGIDYRELAEDVMGGLYQVATGMYSPNASYAVDIQQTDLDAAASYLAAAGYQKDDSGRMVKDGQLLTLTLLTYPSQPDTDTLALAIQSELKELGITIEINQVPDLSAAMSDSGTDWDLAIAGNGTTSFAGDPISSLQNYFASDGPKNFYGIDDPELDTLIDQVAVEMDTDQRDELLREIQSRVGDGAYMGFLGMRIPGVVAGPAWAGYQVPTANLWVDADTSADA
ncbi:ABC transporter substrate-binding protein [Brooklawnia cerclae]|uniref:Peptide/nickel transport system substrate-binding protein n=1 Tax=Brooklawnia cerclae TaxID=349934 RepID=A0ABX0SJ78_9ACTN|nr:ABC transporter substrate-binding protein [Brooklawnia cerclae]NIH56696.1 peptide/nickel transport system substrate-binding protein [Brooklawnia cerclae]